MPDGRVEGKVFDDGEGLWIEADSGKRFKLIGAHMATQMPIDMMWQQSRDEFAQFIGQRVTAEGYISGSAIYSAIVHAGE